MSPGSVDRPGPTNDTRVEMPGSQSLMGPTSFGVGSAGLDAPNQDGPDSEALRSWGGHSGPPSVPPSRAAHESLPQAQGGQRGLARGGSWPVGSPCLTGGPCPGLRPPTNNPQRLCAGQQKSPESCCLQCPRPNLRTGPPPGSPSGCPPPTGQAQVEEAHPFCAEESHPVTVTKCPLRG